MQRQYSVAFINPKSAFHNLPTRISRAVVDVVTGVSLLSRGREYVSAPYLPDKLSHLPHH
jgi:hypothetical protein